ncbi:hypothetical protein K493DRAFT_320115 [Basidiobolus meristosporus CBS 931.73]|uniref:Adenylate cyclase-associated CAP C-terminal domain-containing protein n=1 Tax=Basidiobolus meristosporus CBS 931.73 TaxID=1314790 RepID=A0A1Y1XF57_9FUNG|nr:hypothetical protein K493DRAFT_320115 [Basidiobolus meristosporus CBS 931.73]|eukprot:ORX84357.1 hypothetical protein K493DRAFT_320115 [Basidiobolus meristosporus CBS 931.73]
MEYVINSTCTRIKIEQCRNTRFIFSGKVLTQTIEIWRSEDLDLQFGVQIQTLQLDHSKRVQLSFTTWEYFYSLVWVDSEQLSLSFRDNDTLSFHTGIERIREERPELDPAINQFIVKLEGERFVTEAIRRETGGYLNENR